MIIIKVKVSNDEQTLTEKYLIHEEGIRLSKDDPELLQMVTQTVEKFPGDVDDVQVKAEFQW